MIAKSEPTTVVALFNLKPEYELADYRSLSLSVIRPGMKKMPSVIEFRDFAVDPNTMANQLSDWQICEVIQITSVAEFRRDNAVFPGVEIVDAWNKVVESSTVMFMSDLSLNISAHPGQ